MIIVRRLTGQQFAINPDLLGRIEATPDTILVLVDGTRYIVGQSMDEVVALVRDYRASVIAQAMAEPSPGASTGPAGVSAGAGPSASATRGSDIAAVLPLPTRHKET